MKKHIPLKWLFWFETTCLAFFQSDISVCGFLKGDKVLLISCWRIKNNNDCKSISDKCGYVSLIFNTK